MTPDSSLFLKLGEILFVADTTYSLSCAYLGLSSLSVARPSSVKMINPWETLSRLPTGKTFFKGDGLSDVFFSRLRGVGYGSLGLVVGEIGVIFLLGARFDINFVVFADFIAQYGNTSRSLLLTNLTGRLSRDSSSCPAKLETVTPRRAVDI